MSAGEWDGENGNPMFDRPADAGPPLTPRCDDCDGYCGTCRLAFTFDDDLPF